MAGMKDEGRTRICADCRNEKGLGQFREDNGVLNNRCVACRVRNPIGEQALSDWAIEIATILGAEVNE